MPIFVFRALILVPARAATEETLRTLSQVRRRRGVLHVSLEACHDRRTPDVLGEGYLCPIEGHVSVGAPDASSARRIVEAWKLRVQALLCQESDIAFLRFDLPAL